MPNDPGTALSPRREFEMQLDQQAQNFRALLPSHIPVEKFKRVVVVAVSQNPDLFHADRRSFFNAAQKCAVDGLLPDGRQAALVVYNTKVKARLQDGTYEERWIPAVQYMPMIAGVRQRMRNSGEVLSAEAHVVYRNDKFFQKFGDDPAIVHEPPAFGAERGEPVGAYAIIKLKNGEILREVMDRQQIDRVRAVSKSKDGPAWKGWWDEMARKTVLRRCAKAAPNSADLDTVLARDDEPPEMQSLVELPGREPEPQRHIPDSRSDDGDYASYAIVDTDGEEHEFATVDGAARALRAVLDDAKRRGRSAIEAATENNASAIADIREHAPDLWRDLIDPFGLPPLSVTAAPQSPPAQSAPAPSDGPASPEHTHSAPRGADASPAGDPQPPQQGRTTGEPDGSGPLTNPDQPSGEREALGGVRPFATTATVASGAGGDSGASGTKAIHGQSATTSASHSDRDLLGGKPAEDLTVPLARNPSVSALDYFARQMHAMLAEKPWTPHGLAAIRAANEAGLAKLRAELPDVADQLQAALAGDG